MLDGDVFATSFHISRYDAFYQHVHCAGVGAFLDDLQIWSYVHHAKFNVVNETRTIQELYHHGSGSTTVERNQLSGFRFRAIN